MSATAHAAVDNPAYDGEGHYETPARIASAFSPPSTSPYSPQGGYAAMGSGMEDKLQMLIDRMDNIANQNRRVVTGHYIRAYVPLDIANPAPLGFMAFSLATCLYMTQQAGITEPATQMRRQEGMLDAWCPNAVHGSDTSQAGGTVSPFMAFPLGIFFGGMTMLVVAVLEIFRRNSLGATAFGTFGSFWISIGVYGIIRASGVFFLDSPKGQEAVTALFGVAAVGFMVVSIVINLALPLVFLMIAIMFFLLSAGTTRTDVGKAAGWWGIFTSALAFYVGLAMLFEDMWGREVLPLFYTKIYKKHAKMLFPRVSEHDPMSITAGVPYEGRPELHPGDNVSAMAVTPSLLSMRRNGGPGGASEEKRPAELV